MRDGEIRIVGFSRIYEEDRLGCLVKDAFRPLGLLIEIKVWLIIAKAGQSNQVLRQKQRRNFTDKGPTERNSNFVIFKSVK